MHQNTGFLPKRSLEEHIWPSEKARRKAWFVHPTKESLRMTKETEKTTDQASLIHPYREVLTPRNMTCTLHTTTPTMRLLFNWWKDHARSIKSFDFWCWGVSAKRWSTSVYGNPHRNLISKQSRSCWQTLFVGRWGPTSVLPPGDNLVSRVSELWWEKRRKKGLAWWWDGQLLAPIISLFNH